MKKEIDDIFISKPKKNKEDKASFLSDLKDIEDDNSALYEFLPSSLINITEEKPKKEKKIKKEKNEKSSDDWLFELEELCSKPSKKHIKKAANDIFDTAGMKKKKKKDKKKENGGLINYKKEFEPEMALYKNLLVEQNKFTRSLQQNYDQLSQTRSSSRGITKQMSDLIENINDARSLSMQLVEKNVNAKKLIAELNMKQRKEFGVGTSEGDNMSDFASSYLKQLMTNRTDVINGYDNPDIEDYTEDDMMLEIDEQLDENRHDNVDKLIKYGNITTTVRITNRDIDNYEFIMRDSNGNIIDDIEPPLHTNISVNASTGIATDSYGQKYQIEWVDE